MCRDAMPVQRFHGKGIFLERNESANNYANIERW